MNNNVFKIFLAETGETLVGINENFVTAVLTEKPIDFLWQSLCFCGKAIFQYVIERCVFRSENLEEFVFEEGLNLCSQSSCICISAFGEQKGKHNLFICVDSNSVLLSEKLPYTFKFLFDDCHKVVCAKVIEKDRISCCNSAYNSSGEEGLSRQRIHFRFKGIK